MGRIKKFLTSPKVSVGIFILAAVLLLFSSVGGARAALTYYSETYSSQMRLDNIGVTLMENGADVAWRNYGSKSDDRWDTSGVGVLLSHLPEDEEGQTDLTVGKAYTEELKVRNSGDIGQYVRVTIYRYWVDEKGDKTQEMNPAWIHLNLVNSGQWLEDTAAATDERTVLYYDQVLEPGRESAIFSDELFIDNDVTRKVELQTAKSDNGYTVIESVYEYDGATFCLEVQVDAVQEHNGEDAIRSAWGREVSINNNILSLR